MRFSEFSNIYDKKTDLANLDPKVLDAIKIDLEKKISQLSINSEAEKISGESLSKHNAVNNTTSNSKNKLSHFKRLKPPSNKNFNFINKSNFDYPCGEKKPLAPLPYTPQKPYAHHKATIFQRKLRKLEKILPPLYPPKNILDI